LPTWRAVVERHYETWDRLVDTALLDVNEQVSALVSRLGS
jgi:hypothetical protein